VIDANILRNDIAPAARARRTILVSAASAGCIRLFCARHVHDRELLDRTLILGERHLALVLHDTCSITTAIGRTSPGGSGTRTSRRSPSATLRCRGKHGRMTGPSGREARVTGSRRGS
jgi:hypothetical protein